MTLNQVKAVYFDIGETILDRSREYSAWAERIGVPPHTFSAVFGAVIARGGTVRDVLTHFRANAGALGLDPGSWHFADGALVDVIEADLYPDVRSSLTELTRMGLRVGIAGNQPGNIAAQLRALDLPVAEIATPSDWGVAKPDRAFFERIAQSASAHPAEIVYVGDQIDNDVLPAIEAGLQAVRILRGPWGLLVRDPAAEGECLAVIASLGELPALLSGRVGHEERPDQLRA